jgi:post-segregation antitoxin (ccd killing protein)
MEISPEAADAFKTGTPRARSKAWTDENLKAKSECNQRINKNMKMGKGQIRFRVNQYAN